MSNNKKTRLRDAAAVLAVDLAQADRPVVEGVCGRMHQGRVMVSWVGNASCATRPPRTYNIVRGDVAEVGIPLGEPRGPGVIPLAVRGEPCAVENEDRVRRIRMIIALSIIALCSTVHGLFLQPDHPSTIHVLRFTTGVLCSCREDIYLHAPSYMYGYSDLRLLIARSPYVFLLITLF